MALDRYLAGFVAMAGALTLTGCGGATAHVRQAGQGVALGDPGGSMPATAQFVAQAQAAGCADQRNRLTMIDQRMVFWDRAGSCPDNAYARTLYGASPQTVRCALVDSIAGRRITCADASVRVLFDTILANLDKADLGLGSAHQVEALAIPPKTP